MAQYKRHYVQDLQEDIYIRRDGLVFNSDADSVVITVDILDGGEYETLTGTAVGAVIRSDGSTVPVTNAAVSGHSVIMTLKGACFSVLGDIGVGIQIISGGIKTTILKVIYNVELFETPNVIDPAGTITLGVGDLVQDIADAVATIPADYSDLLAAIAPMYTDLTYPVKAGQYCWYDGTLYTAKQAIATSEAWTAAHWQAADAITDTLADIVEREPGWYNAYSSTKLSNKAVATFDDGAENIPVKDLQVAIEPVQDLHGYDKPWVGGAGKNKLPMTVEGIKATNTVGSWSGNVYTVSDVTFTVGTDSAGNVVSITANGTPSANASCFLTNGYLTASGYDGMLFNGCPSGGSASTYAFRIGLGNGVWTTDIKDTGSGGTISVGNYTTIRPAVSIFQGYTANNIVFKPMIRESSVSDATYAPYSNICPITGFASAKVTKCGKNLFDLESVTNNYYINVSGVITYGSAYMYSALMPVESGKTYVTSLKHTGAGETKRIHGYDKYGNWVQQLGTFSTPASETAVQYSASVTIPSGVAYARVSLSNSLDTNIQFELGSTATTYEAYNAQTVSATFPAGAGTVYGGTLDVTTGQLVVDRAYAKGSDCTWTTNASFSNTYNGAHSCPAAVDNDVNGISSGYVQYTSGLVASHDYGFATSNNGTHTIYVKNKDINSLSDFITHVANVDFVWNLRSPITYTLTPTEIRTLLGTNNIWSDAGDVTVEYRVDPEVMADRVDDIEDYLDDSVKALIPEDVIATQLDWSSLSAGTYKLQLTVMQIMPSGTKRATLKWVADT